MLGIPRVVPAIALTAVATFVACGGGTRRAESQTTVTLTSGMPGAWFQPLGAALTVAYRRSLPEIRFEVHESPGALRNVQALQKGEADIGFTFSDVAYEAYLGRLEEDPRPFDCIRGIAVLQLTPVHVVVRRGTNIQHVRDLRGYHVGVGPAGSGTAITSGLVLRAFGIGPKDVRTENLSFTDVASRLDAATLDAAFVNAGYPVEAIARATRQGGHLLPVEGPIVEQLRSDYPFLRLVSVPGGTYANHPSAVRTIGVDSLLVCRADLSDELVYTLTKTLFEVLPAISTELVSLRQMNMERAPATPVPLHRGAARYYREQELTR